MKAKGPYSRVLITLEGGLMDDMILRYCGFILPKLQVDTIFLMHVSEDLDLPEDIRAKYHEVIPPKEDQLEKYLTELFHHSFGANPPYKVQTVLLEGDPFDQILRQSHIKDIDLIIMGRRPVDHENQLLGARLAEQGPCSILLIPEHANLEINEIFLPLDFSARGEKTTKFCKEIAPFDNVEIKGVHFYAPAKGYLKNAEATRELRTALKDRAKKEWIDYKKALDLPRAWTCDLIENRGEAPAHALFLAEQSGSDLIVLASKGRTASASVLMGSFAKEMVRLNRKVPLLVLKNKRENLDFYEALKSLLD